jgi:hypothetical protein
MPERYEREIEDILRNTERTGPKRSMRERLHLGRRGQAGRPEPMRSRSARSARHLNVSTSEWCLLGGIVLGLVAAGIAYTGGSGNALSGTLAVLAFLCLLLGLLMFWRAR